MPRVACAVVASLTAAVACANAEESCPIKQFRWQEDCSNLAGQTLTGLDQLRYIALDDGGSLWLTFGGEYRLKYEGLDAPDFDIRPADQAFSAIGQRWLLHADLRAASGFRFFVQLSAAAESEREPIERPFDRSNVDVAQAFVDVPVPLFDATIVRLGRQELDSGGNRLIATRDAAALRRTFDMIDVQSSLGPLSATAFYGRPVQNRSDAFDDRADGHELFYGGWIGGRLAEATNAPTLNLFFLVRDRARAVYEQGVASDRRSTVGLRLSGGDQTWDYAAQTAYQFGSFGASDIAAFGAAGDIGWHPDLWARPRIGVSLGCASGDDHAGDKTLGTFDVLYPNLGYFTDAPVYYPGNTVDVQPNVTLNFRDVSLRGGSDVILRLSKRDAVYEPPGIPLIPGNGQGPAFVTALSYLKADWSIDPHMVLSLSGVHGFTGALVSDAGGRDFNYAGLSIDIKM